VDLPDPFGPITPIRSPSETVKERFWKSGALPYLLESPCALISGAKTAIFSSFLALLAYQQPPAPKEQPVPQRKTLPNLVLVGFGRSSFTSGEQRATG
jgi:hypothetical protein